MKLPEDKVSVGIMSAIWGLLVGVVLVLLYTVVLYILAITSNVIVNAICFIVPGIVAYLLSLLAQRFHARNDIVCALALIVAFLGLTSFLSAIQTGIWSNDVINNTAFTLTAVSAVVIFLIIAIKKFKDKKSQGDN